MVYSRSLARNAENGLHNFADMLPGKNSVYIKASFRRRHACARKRKRADPKRRTRGERRRTRKSRPHGQTAMRAAQISGRSRAVNPTRAR